MRRMSKAERKLWASVNTLEDLAELTAKWLEGDLRSQPGYQPGHGPADETALLIPTLARANRTGLLTGNSQPGHGDVIGYDGATWTQRAAVDGWVPRSLAGNLVAAARDAGLLVVTHTTPRRFAPPDFSGSGEGIDVTMRNGEVTCAFGGRWRRRDITLNFAECSDAAIDAVTDAVQIVIADPEYGPHNRLWAFLDQWAAQTKTAPPSPAAEQSARREEAEINRRQQAATNGRNTMGIDDIRAGIANMAQQCQSGIAAIQQAAQQFEEALQTFQQVTNGSNQVAVDQAVGGLARIIETLGEQIGLAQHAVSAAEGYSAHNL